jgi:hypothetical protein
MIDADYNKPRSLKEATTDLARFTATVHVVPETASQPLHPVKPDKRAGFAVNVTTALLG